MPNGSALQPGKEVLHSNLAPRLRLKGRVFSNGTTAREVISRPQFRSALFLIVISADNQLMLRSFSRNIFLMKIPDRKSECK